MVWGSIHVVGLITWPKPWKPNTQTQAPRPLPQESQTPTPKPKPLRSIKVAVNCTAYVEIDSDYKSTKSSIRAPSYSRPLRTLHMWLVTHLTMGTCRICQQYTFEIILSHPYPMHSSVGLKLLTTCHCSCTVCYG